MKKKTTLYLVQAALIAAMYVALTYLSNMAGLWEVRFSEALCILPYFTGAAVPGLTVGCVLANILTGCPLWDVVFGSLATLIGAYIARLLHKKSWWLAPWPNIIANTIAVPLILRYVYTDVSSTYPALVGLILSLIHILKLTQMCTPAISAITLTMPREMAAGSCSCSSSRAV